ncbi:MAG: gamma carbonic anhydrase family protein [Lachnospiraceae bacterium]|nr:gamma carbonic anhydrase family protein [Lachnospiraceae bacterium]
MDIHETVFIAPGATVLGDVTIKEDCGIWYHATVRGDRAPIRIGRASNIQDNCVVHVDAEHPVTIGANVTVGHGAILHGCTIEDNTLIGMGAILLNGCHIGRNCIIAAGALITQNTVIPDNSLVIGNPGKIKREVTTEEETSILENALHYVEEARHYMQKPQV